jgi:hypothetical protein
MEGGWGVASLEKKNKQKPNSNSFFIFFGRGVARESSMSFMESGWGFASLEKKEKTKTKFKFFFSFFGRGVARESYMRASWRAVGGLRVKSYCMLAVEVWTKSKKRPILLCRLPVHLAEWRHETSSMTVVYY